jgi:hypothetical protein
VGLKNPITSAEIEPATFGLRKVKLKLCFTVVYTTFQERPQTDLKLNKKTDTLTQGHYDTTDVSLLTNK